MPLGPLSSWPRTLRGYAQMVLDMPSPAILFWGPEQTQIYNDGYAVILGPRHPRAFGMPYRQAWPDTYPLIHPWMRHVLDNGGHEPARRLRATDAGRGATLVALTGYGQAAEREKAAQAGFDHYMVKPPDPVALRRLLAAVAPAPH